MVYNPLSSTLSEALIALDSEKAFDRVEWDDLFLFWGKIFSWVRLLYASPQAMVRTNGTNS